MSVKTLRLPKKQADIWLKALRSGNYTQFNGGLIDEVENADKKQVIT